MEAKKSTGIIAGICFALAGLLNSFSNFPVFRPIWIDLVTLPFFMGKINFLFPNQIRWEYHNIFGAVALAVFFIIAVGVITKSKIAVVFSCCVGVLLRIIAASRVIMPGMIPANQTVYIIFQALSALFFVFIILTALNNKNAITWGIWAGISAIARLILSASVGSWYSQIVYTLLIFIGAILIGVVFSTKERIITVGNISSVPTSSSSNVEQLVKLKDLLDRGIITQEEFEAKKKQLLGL